MKYIMFSVDDNKDDDNSSNTARLLMQQEAVLKQDLQRQELPLLTQEIIQGPNGIAPEVAYIVDTATAPGRSS